MSDLSDMRGGQPFINNAGKADWKRVWEVLCEQAKCEMPFRHPTGDNQKVVYTKLWSL